MGFFSSFVSFFTGPVADVVLAPAQAVAKVVSTIVGAIPGVPEEAVSFPALAETLFGGGGGTVSPITGRAPIALPGEGGPPLVTAGVPDVPFQREELPILQELGIPFALDPFFRQPSFQPGPVRFPDVEEFDMPPIFQAGVGGLPAIIRQTGPAIAGAVGGALSDLVGGLFARAPQELGAGQVPIPMPRRGAVMAMEKPSTRILRRIFENTGVRIKLSSVKALTRQLGLEPAANCLRVSIMELCTLIITPSPRRRRGISGSDIRIVKRTARRFQSLQEDLSGLVSRRRAAPRRKPRHVHAIAHTAPGG